MPAAKRTLREMMSPIYVSELQCIVLRMKFVVTKRRRELACGAVGFGGAFQDVDGLPFAKGAGMMRE